MQNNATQIAERGIAAIQSAENTQALELIKAQYLGKTGELNTLLKQLGALSVEEKKTVGAHINECKNRFQAAYDARRAAFAAAELQQKLAAEALDVNPARARAIRRWLAPCNAHFAARGGAVSRHGL